MGRSRPWPWAGRLVGARAGPRVNRADGPTHPGWAVSRMGGKHPAPDPRSAYQGPAAARRHGWAGPMGRPIQGGPSAGWAVSTRLRARGICRARRDGPDL